MNEEQKYIDFEAYERVSEPHIRERVSAWRTAIGLQDVDGLRVSDYLKEIAVKLFYDVTTLYFEADYEDDFRKTGFSKEGRHSNSQIILGLLVSLGGYPLAYCIHEGNKYEGHTMLPTINEFVSKYGLENFVVVADSGLMNNANIAELEAHGYKYIIGAKIKNESQEVKNWILEQPKRDCQMVEYDKGGGRRLLVGYTDDRAKKDAYNREKGIRRLEKAYKHGALTKGNINKRGYNKFLSMDGEVKVTINYDRVADDSKWNGLKGYLTNTEYLISKAASPASTYVKRHGISLMLLM